MTTDMVVREQAPPDRDRVLEPAPVPRWTYRDWRVPPGHGDTTPDAAQAARRRRVIHRILHPDQWHAHLEALPHYDPEYVYDEGHEYEDDWTTDPDYCWDGNHLHWRIFDEEGFLMPIPRDHAYLIGNVQEALCGALDTDRDTVLNEPDYHFPEELGRIAGLRTESGAIQTKVQPDVVVLPPGWHDGQLPKSRVLHVDADHPVPTLVVEVVSASTAGRDREGKRALYEALGVHEYLLLDPGGEDQSRPPGLVLDRLQDGVYARVPGGNPDLSVEGDALVLTPVFSEACDTVLRLVRPASDARLVCQWRDPGTGRWRDHDTDQATALLESRVEGRAEGRVEGRVEALLRLLERVLPESAYPGAAEQVAQHWAAHSLPVDAEARVLAAAAEPDRWRDHLRIPANTDRTSPSR
ncbi:MAG: Uma2 family endonuclease [Caldilineaceae bacterium]|nr:Uma2 family endonuclease [Caldilineaceae bacterium]